MQIIRGLEKLEGPVVMTIGNFDGVHLGHQAVLKKAKSIAEEKHEKLAVITFENHPSEVLRADYAVPLLCSLEQRIKLLEKCGVDLLILLKFSKDFSNQTASEFLDKVYEKIPFSHLVLGHDATLGKDRQGDRNELKKVVAEHLQADLIYLDKFVVNGQVVSSSLIRSYIQKGQFDQAEALLGRPYKCP